MDNSTHKIIVGIAGREDSAAAVRYAVDEARRRRLPVHLVHALHPLLTGADADPIAVTRQPVLQEAQRMLEEVADEARRELGTDLPVTTQLVVGHPAAALVEAGAGGAEIVLQPERMGAEHRHVPTYSVTSAVAARSRLPVIAVPPYWSVPEHAAGVVAVGVDEVGSTAHLLQAAFEEALARAATLRVVHTWRYSEAFDDVVFDGRRKEAHSAELAARLREDLDPLTAKFTGVPVDLAVRHGRPADAIIEESRRCDLVVVGRHRTGNRVSHHLGSVVRAVVRESRSAVLVVDPVDAMWVAEDSRG
ncbi:universal stress protein [Nocardioides aquiterrae]|uniref:Universal stress protein n=1 Tax=Nocardioides aquiterrae TaxID=203799 RepID=A0ABP4F3Q9_9ACTN